MRKSLTTQLIDLFVTVILAYTVTAIVPRWMSTYLSTYFYMLVVVLCIFLVVILRGKSSLNEYIILIIPFLLWKLLVFFATKPSLIDWGYTSLLDFTPIILGLFITKRLDYSQSRYFSIVLILLIVVTMLTTYIGNEANPNAARYMATVADPNEAEYVKYNLLNIGGFEFIYTIVLLYPILIYAYKLGKINLFLTLVFAVFELLVIVESEYTIAFLLWLISTPFLFFNRNFKARYLIIVGVFTAFVLFFLSSAISQGLRALAEIVPSKDIAQRLEALAGGESALQEFDDNRLELYLLSINTFLSHPLFGALTSGGGGHSFILENLARFGLVGAVIFVTLYAVIFKKFFLPYKNAKGYGYIVWVFVQTLILSTFNPGMWLYVLCLYVPVLLKFITGGEAHESALGSQYGIA